jgi:hypothetical protein
MLGIGRYINVLLQYFGLNGIVMSFIAAWCVALESTKLDIHTREVDLYRQATGPPNVRLEFTGCVTKSLLLTLAV